MVQAAENNLKLTSKYKNPPWNNVFINIEDILYVAYVAVWTGPYSTGIADSHENEVIKTIKGRLIAFPTTT